MSPFVVKPSMCVCLYTHLSLGRSSEQQLAFREHVTKAQALLSALTYISQPLDSNSLICFKCLEQYPHFVKYLINTSY